MSGSINSLMNMEYQLYGGTNFGTQAPSMLNGYMGNFNATNYNPYMYGYNPSFMANPYGNSFGQTNTINNMSAAQNPNFQRVTQEDLNNLAKYYADNMDPSESLLGAAAGGGAFALIMNPRLVAHPIGSLRATFGDSKEMFKDISAKGDNVLKTLWKSNPQVIMDAQSAMHKIEARQKSYIRTGLWRKKFGKDSTVYEESRKLMQDTITKLKAGTPEEIEASLKKLAETTAKLEETNVKNGLLPRAWNGICNLFRENKKEIGKPIDIINAKFLSAEATKKSAEIFSKDNKNIFMKTLKKGGVKGGAFFIAIDFLLNWDKIKTAFAKDNKTGWKQFGQTGVKGVGSAVGWAVGEAAGAWAGAKLGALAGTAICPGLGTAIGAVAGLVGGSAGVWFAGKATKALVGKDVADDLTAQEMTKTPEGQAQLVQLVAEKSAANEKVDPIVFNAANRLAIQLQSQPQFQSA